MWEQDVSEEGFPVSCLPIGTSPLRTTVTASEESEAAETSRGAFSVLSRQEVPLKRKLSDAMGVPPLPDASRCRKSSFNVFKYFHSLGHPGPFLNAVGIKGEIPNFSCFKLCFVTALTVCMHPAQAAAEKQIPSSP